MQRIIDYTLLSSSTIASASISISQSGSMKRTTCMIVFAGRMLPKNSPWTAATCSQSCMRVNKILVRKTSESLPPSRSMADWIISRQRRAWAAASPFANVLPSGPSGAVPVTAMTLPLRTAREIPTLGSKGDPVETRCRDCCRMFLRLPHENHNEIKRKSRWARVFLRRRVRFEYRSSASSLAGVLSCLAVEGGVGP